MFILSCFNRGGAADAESKSFHLAVGVAKGSGREKPSFVLSPLSGRNNVTADVSAGRRSGSPGGGNFPRRACAQARVRAHAARRTRLDGAGCRARRKLRRKKERALPPPRLNERNAPQRPARFPAAHGSVPGLGRKQNNKIKNPLNAKETRRQMWREVLREEILHRRGDRFGTAAGSK